MVLRVLLVDDEETLTEIAVVFLERDNDLKVDTSPSAKSALEKLKSDNYDVIVSDYMMPEMNGIELLKKLKSEDNATPFILFTGRGREDVAIDALNSGASFYLQKGGDPKSEFAELTNMIKRSARHAQVEKAHAELMVDIQRSYRLLSATLESTVDGILGVDRDGNVLVYNNRFVEIWGIPEHVIKSRHWDQMMPCILDQLKDPDEFKNTIYNGFRELNLQNRSIVELKDGRVFDCVSNSMLVNDEAVGRIANFRDITNQARAEGTLRREKEKAQQYLSLAGVMLLALDDHGEVTLVNKRGCEILGYEEGQILGKSWFENFLPERIRDQFRAVFKGLMDGDLGPLDHQLPHPVLCRGGVERYIAFTNALLKNEKGDITGTLSSGEDVTERKQAEEALKVSLAKYTTLFESLPLGMTIADKDGNITESNKEAERLLGLSREDQIKRQIDGQEWRIVRPDGSLMPASEYASVRAMKENRRCSDVEMGIVKGDGSTSWINVTAAPIPLDGSGVAITYTDITDRKQATAALRELEGRYHNLVEGMLEGVAYCRMLYDERGHPVDWIYLTVNSNFEKLTGLRNITGKRVTEAIPGIEKADPTLFEIYGRVASNGQPEKFEMEVKSLGQWLRVSVFCPEKDHFVAVFEDITERKKSEVVIAESLEKRRELESIIDKSPAIAFTWKPGPDWSVAFVSNSVRQFGYVPEDFTSRRMTYADLVHPEDLKRVNDESEAFSKKGVSEFTQEYRILTKSGDVRWVDDRTAILRNAKGESVFHQGIIFDITEQRRVERALKQANKKLALLGNVTRHDAINRLSVLMAWLDIAMEVGKDLPTMEQLIRAQESARMLQGQLEFTAGYQEIGLKQPQWIDLKAAACAGVEGIDLGAVSIKLDLKGAEIFADSMLEKVFHNLVGNSLRHGEKVTRIRLYIEESGGRLTIVCEDDGVGIPVDEKEKIFVRGYGKHTGLGLYLAREILELTGIAIKETGVPGKGARFEMLVPTDNYKIGRGG